jgi:hypothetical protein
MKRQLDSLARAGQRGLVVVLLAGLRAYRMVLSPLIGPACRFHPSCSVYAEQALRGHGVMRGSGLALWRVLRCHPFAHAGLDPVPEATAAGSQSKGRAPAGA